MRIRDRVKELRRVRAGDLLPNPRNWRRHPQHQADALRGVLAEIGYADALLARETPEGLLLIDGHLRAETTPDAVVPVLVLDVTEAEADLLLATLDPLAALAQQDDDALRTLLARVHTESDAVHAMLAGLVNAAVPSEIGEDPGPQVDRGAELREKWGTAGGQLWAIGPHRLLCGDSTKPEDVARVMRGERAALMATDPPYLVDYQGGEHPQAWHKRSPKRDKHWDDYHDPEAGVEFYTAFLRVARDGALTAAAAIYQWHAHRRQALVEQAWREAGLLVHQQIIWRKARAVLTHSHFMWQHEPCFYGWAEGHPPERKPPANATTVWEIDQRGDGEHLHPTQKPVELFRRPIEYHTGPGGVCFEPFGGSGSQVVAAAQLGRRCYAIEIAPEFVAAILERLAGMGLEPRLVEGHGRA